MENDAASPKVFGLVMRADPGTEYAICKHCGEEIQTAVDKSHWTHLDFKRGCRASSRTEDPEGIGDESLDSRWTAKPKKATA